MIKVHVSWSVITWKLSREQKITQGHGWCSSKWRFPVFQFDTDNTRCGTLLFFIYVQSMHAWHKIQIRYTSMYTKNASSQQYYSYTSLKFRMFYLIMYRYKVSLLMYVLYTSSQIFRIIAYLSSSEHPNRFTSLVFPIKKVEAKDCSYHLQQSVLLKSFVLTNGVCHCTT